MRKTLLTTFVILLSFSSAHAASGDGRVKMVVVRTNVVPADINIVKSASQIVAADSKSLNSYTIEIVY